MSKCVYIITPSADVMPDGKHPTNLIVDTSWFNDKTPIHRRYHSRRRVSHIPTVFHSSLALLIMFISVHIVSSQNTLAPSISSTTAYLQGSTPANLTCSLSTNVTPTTSDFPLSWTRDGGLPSSASTLQSQQAGSGGTVTYQNVLTFAPTALDNEVPISCNAKIDSLTGSTSYSPQVILVPDDPVITGPSIVEASENQTWTCEADGASRIAPNVYWRNGRGEALTTGVTKSTTITSPPNQNTVFFITQNITAALPAAAAEYRLSCIVVHELGQYNVMKTATKIISVLFPPQITKTGGNTVYAIEGQQTTLSCIIRVSNPPASNVSWTRDGVSINLTSARYVSVNTSSPSLTILSSLRGDHGDYVCTAANSEGSTSFTTPTTLIVRYPPTVGSGNGTGVEGSAGGSLTIPCPVDAVPLPTAIVWKRVVNGQIQTINVTGSSRYSGGSVDNQQYNLTINPVQGDDAGTYFCEAVNDLGTGTGPNVTTVVNSPFEVNVPSTYYECNEGAAVSLGCSFYPTTAATSIQWVRYDSDSVSANYSLNYPNLTIEHVSARDFAVYYCVVSTRLNVYRSSAISLIVNSAPYIALIDKTTYIQDFRQNITLPCPASGWPPPIITWLKNGRTFNVTDATKYVVSSQGPTLTIINLAAEDAATFQCVATNRRGNSTGQILQIKVLYEPVVNLPPTVEALEGYNFTIPCKISMYPAVTSVVWFKGTTQLNIAASSGKYSGGTVQNASLTVRSAVKSDGGTYKCQGSNGTASVSGTTVVTVTYPPKVSTPTSDVNGRQGQTATIGCTVDAVPPATSIEWKKYDISANNNTATSVSIGGRISGGDPTTPSLTISNLESSDMATYYCIVSNRIGNTTSNPVNLRVQYQPIVQVAASPSVLKIGDSFQLTCTATANPAPTRFQWYKGSVLISSTANFTQTQATVSDYTDFKCNVTNTVGVSSAAVRPNIQFSPQLIGTGKVVIAAKIETNITLDCLVLANPDPTSYAWYKEGILIANSTQKTVSVFLSNETDFGSYSCGAQNTFGSLNPAREFTVQENVTVINIPPTVEAQEGYNFTIPCKISMYPAVTSVAWFKGTTQLNIPASSGKYSGGTVQDASLTVRSAVKSDAGTYKCQGSNGTASVSGTTVVTVTYPPKVSTPTSDVIGILGKTATVRCTVDAVPPATSIEWKKYDIGASNNTATLVSIGGRISGGNLTTPSLTISNLETSDTATYFCVVSNRIGNTTSNPANLRVQYQPIVQVAASPSVLKIGDSFQLTCTATANPAPTRFQWYKGSVLISSTANFTQTQATVSDYTDFKCSVTNTVGVTSATVRPNIQFSPQLVGTGKVTIVAKIETNITLDCLVLANPDPTSYAWYKEDTLVAMATQKTMSVFLSNQTDFGSYSCSAQNTFGSLYPAREFTVQEDKGSSKKDTGLSTAIIILIVILAIIFLILLILLIVCCCLYGVCAKKRKKSKVDPDTNHYTEDNAVLRKPSIPLFIPKPNGDVAVNDGDVAVNDGDVAVNDGDVAVNDGDVAVNGGDDDFIVLATPTSNLESANNHGSIISLPEKTGARPYHLPPLDPITEPAGNNLREDEKRRSRRKKQKIHKNEDKSALTGSEERTDSISPTT